MRRGKPSSTCATQAVLLTELGDILGLLRQPGEPDNPTAPAPGLAALPDLLAFMGAAGLAVDWSVRGRERPLGPVVDLVAYRVLQEALTNAHRHGTGLAAVTVDYGETFLSLTVVNPAAVSGRPRAVSDRDHPHGLGLVGMRERAVAHAVPSTSVLSPMRLPVAVLPGRRGAALQQASTLARVGELSAGLPSVSS